MAFPDLVSLTVDGRHVEAAAGTSLLDLLRGLGLRIPTLCHDARLTPYGGCRLCVVARRDGRGGLVPACSTPALAGMVIETQAPEVVESRRLQLQLLGLNHRLECPACERHGDCRFQELLYEIGVPERRLTFERIVAPRDESSPVIVRDPEKCILCGKCVRLCDQVQGVAAIGVVHRGLGARVATQLDRPLDCEFCGQCVNACPVGAIVARPYRSEVPTWLRERSTTICSFCSCGCELGAETHDGRLIRVSSHEQSEPNHGKLCVKGWLGLDVLSSEDRLKRPLVRRNGRLVETGWDEALAAVASALRDARAAGSRVVGLGNSRLACEDAYLFQRLLRAGVGSPHVGIGPSGGASALVEGMGELTGEARSSADFDGLRAADLVFVLRADPTRTHPLVKTELVQGVRQRGQKLVLAHALSGGLERHAALHLTVEPAGEEPLLNSVVARLREREPEAAARLAALPGHDEWLESLAEYPAEAVSRSAGVTSSSFDALVELLRRAHRVVTVVVTGLGIPGDEAAVTRGAVVLDGLLGSRGAGVLVLGEKANLQGALDVGLHPQWLPGRRPAGDARARAEVEAAWRHPLPAGPGLPMAEALHPPAGTALGVLYLAGQDPVGAWPGSLAGAEAIARANIVVVQDAFLTETARRADVVLPVAILAERSGSVVGADAVRRPLRQILAPPPGLPQDGQVFGEIAARLGAPPPEGAALEAEMAALVGWPRPVPALRRLVPARPASPHQRRDGMLLDASPQLFRSGSVTEHSRVLQELAPSVALRLAPRDAGELGVRNGDPVRLTASGREALLRARVDPTVRPGTVVAAWRRRFEPGASLMLGPDDPTVVEVRRSR